MYRGERVNSISHLVGAALAVAALVLLIVWSAGEDGWRLASALVYGITLFLLFLFSTLFHSFRGRTKAVFHRFDHIGIYLLIAGTYTPYCLVVLREDKGWLIFGIVWGIALLGITFKAVFGPRYQTASTLLYLAAGWTILIDISAVYARLSFGGFFWLLLGGVLYTVGAFFFSYEKMPRNHELWHFFVLAAAVCHFVSIFFHVL
jgi:hemolysin III